MVRLFDMRQPLFYDLIRHIQVNDAVFQVDGNDISVLHRGQRSALPGLRGNVADTRSAGGAGESSVGDHGGCFMKSHADQHGGGDGKLPHAGTALRPLVAHHKHAAGLYGTGLQMISHLFLRVKYDGRTGMTEHLRLYPALLYHTAAWSKIAVENGKAAFGIQRVIDGMNHLPVDGEVKAVEIIPERCSEYHGHIQVQVIPNG